MEIEAIRDQLLKALEDQKNTQIAQLDTTRDLAHQQINVGANAAGTLFSSAPVFKQTQWVGENYVPKVSQVNIKFAENQVKIQNTVAEALKKIQAVRDATAELNRQ